MLPDPRRSLGVALGVLVCGQLVASPPVCDQKGEFLACTREDQNCAPFVDQNLKSDPSRGWMENWNGCIWPAGIYKSHQKLLETLSVAAAHVLVSPSYLDSEYVDIVVEADTAKLGHRRFDYKHIPVMLLRTEHGLVPNASVDIFLPWGDEFIGVPTVDFTETGGKRTMTHSYH